MRTCGSTCENARPFVGEKSDKNQRFAVWIDIVRDKELAEVAAERRLQIAHTFETFEGDHSNHLKDRIELKVLPFFSGHLVFPRTKK